MLIIIDLGSSNDSFLHRTSEQEEVMNDTCGCCLVVFRTISSWVLVLCFVLGIVSGDSKPFHRWSWHRVDHMASRHLLEDTFVAQPSVQGSQPSSSPSIMSYLTFELRPTSSASASKDIPSCRRIVSSASRPSQEESRLAFLKVCNISGGGALFDWNDAKASTIVLLDDTPLSSGCRVHIGIAQLPVVLQHRVAFSPMAEQGRALAGEGARIECRVSEIWQTTNPDAGDGLGIPNMVMPLAGGASSAACVTERFRDGDDNFFRHLTSSSRDTLNAEEHQRRMDFIRRVKERDFSKDYPSSAGGMVYV